MLMDRTVPVDIDDFSDDFTHCFTGECRVNVLPILFQISQIITESEDLGVLARRYAEGDAGAA